MATCYHCFGPVGDLFSFSFCAPYGLHIDDDGLLLDATRRIFVHGEIPHLDFIHLRPLGTTAFWAVFFPLSGDYLHLVTRTVVLAQFVVISFVWFFVVKHAFALQKNFAVELSVFLLTVFFSVATHWIFPLYTTDGVFWCSMGYGLWYLAETSNLDERKATILKWSAYALMGFAGLAKQNFLAFAPIVALSTSEWRKLWLISPAALPAVFYMTWLYWSGALADFMFQMQVYPFSATFWEHGVKEIFFQAYFPRSIFFGLLLWWAFYRYRAKNMLPLVVCLAFVAMLFYYLATGKFFARVPLILFFASPTIYLLQKPVKPKVFWPLFGLGWASALSLSFHYPHGMGGFLAFILFSFMDGHTTHPADENQGVPRRIQWAFLGTAWLGAFIFYQARANHTYTMSTTLQNPYPIEDIIPGSKGMVWASPQKTDNELRNKFMFLIT